MFKGIFPFSGLAKAGFKDPCLGAKGEDVAAAHLQQKGYEILCRNYRQRFGEIDIVARDGEVLVFVEVKTRRSLRYGSAFEAIDRRKQHQLAKVALHYISRYNLHDQAARFDVIAVGWENEKPEIELLTNAFELSD